MLDDNAYGLSRRRVTLSTSGIVPAIDRLRDACPVALAVSLHAPNDALRDRLVPINRKYPLRRAARRVPALHRERAARFRHVRIRDARRRQRRAEHARELVALVRDVPCKFNLIPFNPFPNTEFRTSSRTRILAFQRVLQDAGLVATIRKTRGDDIDAACGQLAGQVQDRTTPHAAQDPAGRGSIEARLPCLTVLPDHRLRVAVAACGVRQQSVRRQSCDDAARAADPRGAAAAADGEPAPSARSCTPISAAGYYERGQMDVALEELNTAVKLDPNYAPAYNIYGLVYAMLGEDRKAEQNFERALQLAPERFRDPSQLGLVPVPAQARARSAGPVRSRRQQSAVPDAGDRAGQCRPLRAGDRRHRAPPKAISGARSPDSRATCWRATASR